MRQMAPRTRATASIRRRIRRCTGSRSAGRARPYALQTAARLGVDESIVEDARGRVEPERLRIAELLAETERPSARPEEREAAARERVEAERLAERAESARPHSTKRSRSSARRRRKRAKLHARRPSMTSQ